MAANEKLIVALDVDTAHKALELVDQLRDVAGMFKIGSTLFTAVGPQIVRDIIASGSRVFLDLKFHDIPHQVAGAARSAGSAPSPTSARAEKTTGSVSHRRGPVQRPP